MDTRQSRLASSVGVIDRPLGSRRSETGPNAFRLALAQRPIDRELNGAKDNGRVAILSVEEENPLVEGYVRVAAQPSASTDAPLVQMSIRSRNAVVLVGALCLAGCDYLTRMERATSFEKEVSLNCLDHALSTAPAVAEFRAIPGSPESRREYAVAGVNGGQIAVVRPTDQPSMVTVSFGWFGRTDAWESGPSRRLVEQVHEAILMSCEHARPVEVSQYCSDNLICATERWIVIASSE